MKRNIFLILAISIFLFASLVLAQEGVEKMKLSSPDFANNEFIPKKFTCLGEDINPALIIESIPKGAKSLVLIVDDPDAPMGTWVHWVVYNIPLISKIVESSVPGHEGINDFGKRNYGGPCPPSGTHRYFFKIYALDSAIMISGELIPNKQTIEDAMQGHILDSAELIGLFKK